MKEKLNGYWTSEADPAITICIDRVFKKGYVTGYSYVKTLAGTVYGKIKLTNEELLSGYKRQGKQ